eukprot:3186446-Amphidinium_carterae.1
MDLKMCAIARVNGYNPKLVLATCESNGCYNHEWQISSNSVCVGEANPTTRQWPTAQTTVQPIFVRM